jgi:predicted Zn-dependent peptidase
VSAAFRRNSFEAIVGPFRPDLLSPRPVFGRHPRLESAVLERRLPDGTAVWLDPMRDVRSLALSVTMAGGSAEEEPEERGATHFLEHLLFKRTRRRSGAAVARITDRLGGECDAYTTKESVSFHARVPSERAAEAVDLLCDLTAGAAFTAADVKVERGVILEEMAEAEDLAEDLLHEAFVRRLWPTHALGAPILGTRETVSGLTHARLAARFRAIARPARTLVAVAGAFDPDRLVDLLARARAPGRPAAPAARAALAPASGKPRAARCAFHLARPDLQQTHLLVGGPTIPFGHPLVPAAWIATEVLGGGVSSRLWRDVRERRGLAYTVGTGLTLHRAAGVALVSAATQPKNLARLVATMARALRRFREDGITPAELRRARNQFHAEAALSLESTASRRESAVRAWLYRGRPYSTEQFLADVDRVTLDDVAAAIGCLYGDTNSAGHFGLGIAGPLPAGTRPEVFVRHLADDVSEALAA